MNQSRFDGRFLGVLGGMGPLAGATFMSRLAQLSPAVIDQDHIPAILWNDPRVPPRTVANPTGDADPFPWMLNGVRHLEQAGARALAIPCNTAHLWYAQLQRETRLPILHIVEAVIRNLHQHNIDQGPVGLMATDATLQSNLYQSMLSAHGYECISLHEPLKTQHSTVPIALVKQNRFDAALEAIGPGIDALQQKGVQAIILGCTELPLALPHGHRDQWTIPVIDSIDALALAALAWYERTA